MNPTITPTRTVLAALCACVVACSGTSNNGDAAVDGDVATVACSTPGRSFCQNGAYYACSANGRATQQAVCGSTAPECVDGIGCVVCRAGELRCDPSHANTPQTCRADNSGYDSQATCDTTMNQMCTGGQCLDPCGAAALEHSYIGCEYWPVTLKNTCMGELGGTFPFAIAIANPQTTPVTVTVTGGGMAAPMMQTIAAGALQTIELPFVDDIAQLLVRPGTSVVHPGGAYHVVASAPVTAYQFNPLTYQSGTNYSYSNDASLLLPASVLGANYLALMWPGITFQIGDTPPWESGGTITVVGTATAPTQVTVTLAGTTFDGTGVVGATAPGTTQMYSLAAGDVLQLLGHGASTDLTGTTLHATAPVAVYTGHGCAQVPTDRAAGNHLEEQLFPNQAWGKQYAVTAFIDRPGLASSVRIMALQAGTTLTFDPASAAPPMTSLGAGQFVEFDPTVDFMVTGNNPILVAQFMYGGGLDSGEGDPAMVYEVPVEQYRTQYTVLTPSTFDHGFVNIVARTTSPPMLDGAAFPGTSTPIGGSGYSVWATEVTAGVHSASSTSGDTLGIKVYGTAEYTAYAYPGGLDLNAIVPQ